MASEIIDRAENCRLNLSSWNNSTNREWLRRPSREPNLVLMAEFGPDPHVLQLDPKHSSSGFELEPSHVGVNQSDS
jgi:hypothetical protein